MGKQLVESLCVCVADKQRRYNNGNRNAAVTHFESSWPKPKRHCNPQTESESELVSQSLNPNPSSACSYRCCFWRSSDLVAFLWVFLFVVFFLFAFLSVFLLFFFFCMHNVFVFPLAVPHDVWVMALVFVRARFCCCLFCGCIAFSSVCVRASVRV